MSKRFCYEDVKIINTVSPKYVKEKLHVKAVLV